jgi:hypothetical protein
MSNGTNHRRGHDKIQDHGPTWEGGPPSSGCNSTHVAKARRDWHDIRRRGERRNGATPASFHGGRPVVDDDLEDLIDNLTP